MGIRKQLARPVARLDADVDRAFGRLRGRPTADRLMYVTSELGDWSLIWQIVGTAQALRPSRRPISAVRLAVVLGAESALVNGPIKSLFRRHRPIPPEVRPFRLRQPRTSSFPSGHASSAFTFAGVASENDDLWPLYYALATVVAASRVHVKIHHASDVIAGAALGFALSRLVRRAWPAPGSTGD